MERREGPPLTKLIKGHDQRRREALMGDVSWCLPCQQCKCQEQFLPRLPSKVYRLSGFPQQYCCILYTLRKKYIIHIFDNYFEIQNDHSVVQTVSRLIQCFDARRKQNLSTFVHGPLVCIFSIKPSASSYVLHFHLPWVPLCAKL